jgi:stage II sporulation protein M
MKETWGYIKKSKVKIAVLTAIFLLGVILGLLSYPQMKEQTKEIAEMLKNLVIGESKPLTALKIFLKNLEASFVALILGPTIILPLIVVFSNGFLTGLVANMALEKGKTAAKIATGLLPHGVLELLAFFLTISMSMDITLSAINPEGRPRLQAVKETAKKALKTYLKIVVPLLLIAALAETYISVQLIQ